MAPSRISLRYSTALVLVLATLNQSAKIAYADSIPAVVSNATVEALTDHHAYLGVSFHTGPARYLKGDDKFGCVIIDGMDEIGPAAGAGLEKGDEVCSVNGLFFESGQALMAFLRSRMPGDDVKIFFFREPGKQVMSGITTLAKFTELSIPFRTIDLRAEHFANNGGALGLVVDTATRVTLKDRSDESEHAVYAAKILAFDPDSVLGDSAAQTSDLLYEINGRYFSDFDSYVAYIHSFAPGDEVVIGFFRNSEKRPFKLKVIVGPASAPAVAARVAAWKKKEAPSLTVGQVAVGATVAIVGVYALSKLLSAPPSSPTHDDSNDPSKSSSSQDAVRWFKETTPPAANDGGGSGWPGGLEPPPGEGVHGYGGGGMPPP